MARYIVRHSYVNLIGRIWMPSVTCAEKKNLSQYDIDNIKAHGDEVIDRDAVEQWLTCNSGYFQSVQDFEASIEDGSETVDIPWNDPESECVYGDCMFPAEGED
jgi:hypothetical protein